MNPAFTPPSDYTRREVEATKACIGCGCTEFDACRDENGETCSWVPCADGPLCSFCAEIAAGIRDFDDGEAEASDDEPLVQLATDAECNAMLRARRAGA